MDCGKIQNFLIIQRTQIKEETYNSIENMSDKKHPIIHVGTTQKYNDICNYLLIGQTESSWRLAV